MNKMQMAQYAYEHVPFYQRLMTEMPERWEEFPLVERKVMSEHIDLNLSPEYMADYLRGNLEFVMTSGSTGQCLTVYWDSSQRIRSLLPLWMLRKRYYGITPESKRCYFFTTKVVGGQLIERERCKYGLGFSKMDLSEDNLICVYEEMKAFDPKWLLLQPSMAMLLVHTAKVNHLPALSGVRYIELTGERIPEGVKQTLKEFFHCSVASQYGCYEVNSIAYECPCGNMHVMDGSVHVEVIDSEQNPVWDMEGEICLTSLQNKAMPFVRYKVGDFGQMRHGIDCPCGNQAPVIKLAHARDNDLIINEDGSVIHSDILAHAVEVVNLNLEFCIIQYQIVQIEYWEFDVYFVLDEEDEKEVVMELFLQNLGGFADRRRFHFSFPDYLNPEEKTGKLAWFVSKVEF